MPAMCSMSVHGCIVPTTCLAILSRCDDLGDIAVVMWLCLADPPRWISDQRGVPVV